jgi:MoxR-like ATPase
MSQSGCYGAQINGEQLTDFLDKFLESNLVLESTTGRRPTPLCIWGTHGLGKTEIAMEVAHKKQWKLAYCAPAQFEEMGDLHGLPFKVDPDPNVIGDERTVYMTPEWVPKDEGPGILLLDDLNRADDRILRGTMQLLQNFEMFSWALPPKWQIVVTANPDSGDYAVTSMDDAIITRMIHLTLNFDAKIWAEWALNYGIDERGVNFVLTYPEMVTLKRTTPRTLVHFFGQLVQIKDLKKDIFIVEILAKGCLDEETATAFINYVDELLIQLPSPEDFLNENNLNEIDNIILALLKTENGIRLDTINTLLTRVIFKLKSKEYVPTPAAQKVIEHILLNEEIPLDLRYGFHVDINKLKINNSPSQQLIFKILTNKEILSQFVKMF